VVHCSSDDRSMRFVLPVLFSLMDPSHCTFGLWQMCFAFGIFVPSGSKRILHFGYK